MTKRQIIAIAAAALIGLALGRYSLPAKVITKTETIEVDKKQSETDSNKQDHSVIIITKTVNPDGTTKTVTEIKKDVENQSETKTSEEDSKDTKTSKEVIYDSGKWSLSALAVTKPLSSLHPAITYGADISYKILGPFQVGVLGLTDGTLGVSFGITF